ncbi:putative lipid II flippase FtsW [Candidatus Collierbacteria bacterium]|nr:putative lipid II flippase FtsW [Candidatus Collierbacteria bacterium]
MLLPSSRRLTLTIFLLSLTISLFGLVAVYNASVVEGYSVFNDKYHFAKQQLFWILAGILVFLTLSRFPPLSFKKVALPLFLTALFFLLLVLIPGIGAKVLGARRWLALGPVRFQPSELMKLSLIVYLSVWLQSKRSLSSFIAIIFLCLGLIMLQPDLGTAIIIATTSFIIYYLSGTSVNKLFAFSGLLGLIVSLLILFSPYRLQRLKTFLDPTSDPLGSSYHINQILLSLGSGNWFGVGLGRSRQKYAYLPEATTDSIFAIIAEETGFIGGLFTVALLLALTLLAFKIAHQQSDSFAKLLASGVAVLIMTQTFLNIASMTALVPLTGVPLPLISYGGSSMLTIFAALGILSSVARHQ